MTSRDKSGVQVRAGQVWSDNDPREGGVRRGIVMLVNADEGWAEVCWRKPGYKSRTTRVRLGRFRNTHSGYLLIYEPTGDGLVDGRVQKDGGVVAEWEGR